MNKVLVTGLTGFIGFPISKSLLSVGVDVFGINNV